MSFDVALTYLSHGLTSVVSSRLDFSGNSEHNDFSRYSISASVAAELSILS